MALTGNQREAAALAIACGTKVTDAAEKTGVSLRTLHRWLHEDPSFCRRVEELRERMYSQAAGRLTELAGMAADTLGELLESGDAKVRIQAARMIFLAADKFHETTAYSARLAALEQLFENGGDTCAR
jgi:hypothetical protein